MTTSSPRVQLSVLDAKKQKSIWCASGIDLFVYVQIDPTDSRQAACLSSRSSWDASRPCNAGPHPFSDPPVSVCKESEHIAQTLQNWEADRKEVPREPFSLRGRRRRGDPSVAKVLQGILHDNLRPMESDRQEYSRNDHGKAEQYIAGHVRNLPDGCASYLEVQLDRNQRSKSLAEIMDHDMLNSTAYNHAELHGLDRKEFRNGSVSPGALDGECESLVHDTKAVEVEDVGTDDLEDHCVIDVETYTCNENRSWSPQVEDYFWVPTVDIKPHNPEMSVLREKLESDSAHLVLQSLPSTSQAMDKMERRHETVPKMARAPALSPGQRKTDIIEISAACQLLEMSCCDCKEDCGERDAVYDQNGPKKRDVYNLGFQGASSLERPTKIVEEITAKCLGIDSRDASISRQPGLATIEESWRSGGVRYSNTNGGTARMKSLARTYFRASEIDQASNGEVLDYRPPSKRQYKYKSIRELVRA